MSSHCCSTITTDSPRCQTGQSSAEQMQPGLTPASGFRSDTPMPLVNATIAAMRGSIVLRCGLQVDIRVVAPESFGAARH
jgi:hypothetical protein